MTDPGEEVKDARRLVVLEALTDLVDTARTHRDSLPEERIGYRQQWETIALHLDAVRTRVVQEDDAYLDVAWAFVDSGRLTIARLLARSGRRIPPADVDGNA